MPPRPRKSEACRTCRTRRIKCDLRRPRCAQCDRASWPCEWTSSDQELVFYDETAQAARRSEARPRRARRGHQTAEKCHQERSSSSLHRSLPINLDELALGFFFFKYVYETIDARPITIDDGNGCLLMSIKTLGAAGITQDSLCNEVQSKYFEAIRLTNEALQSSKSVRRDSTLLAVNVLSIFEAVSRSSVSMKSWRNHVSGAGALIQVRGAEQFKGPAGGRLFVQVGIGLAISCLQRRKPFPRHYSDAFLEIEENMPEREVHILRFLVLMSRFVDLYAKLLPTNCPRSLVQANSVVQESFDLEEQISSFSGILPTDWQPTTVKSSDPAVFGNYYYVYQTSIMAQTMNGLRCMKIILADILLKSTELYSESTIGLSSTEVHRLQCLPEIIQRLQSEILATIPQHLGHFLDPKGFEVPDRVSVVRKGPPDRIWRNFVTADINPWAFRGDCTPVVPSVRMAGGYLFHWPLFVAGAASAPGGDVRAWVVRALNVMADRMGLHQAHILASLLQDSSSVIGTARLLDSAKTVSKSTMKDIEETPQTPRNQSAESITSNVSNFGST